MKNNEAISTLQKWVITHDLTVKYIAVVMTLMLILELLQAVGVLHNT